MAAMKQPTADAISIIMDNPSPTDSSQIPEIVVQVLNLNSIGNRYKFTVNDGKQKLNGLLPSQLTSKVISGEIQNLGLIRILDYTLNDNPKTSEKYLIVTKCQPVSPALEMEVKTGEDASSFNLKATLCNERNISEMKKEASFILKPKQEIVSKSAAQIVHEQSRNMAPAARMAMTRRVRPLVSLNPYEGSWTIKVRLTNKGNMRTYKNARGEGCVFNVELTDEDGTEIQATMFNEAARKFHDKFQLGKVYYISKGILKVANKQFKTVQNDYEMTLNENSEVDEVRIEEAFVPETKFNFVLIDMLGPYVNGRELVDVIGVVQTVSPSMSIRRKSNNESIPKRDITIADETEKTVVVSLWNELATGIGQELLDMVDKSPIVAIKSLKVGDFQGVSLSAISRSTVLVNPDIPEAKKLRSWYDSEGKETSMASIGTGLTPMNNAARSMYSDRAYLSDITGNPSLGEEKPVVYNIRAFVSRIRHDQAMWYRACKTCKKKVTESLDSGFWCEGCQKNDADCSLRYIVVMGVFNPSGEAFVSVFNDEAEKIIECSADELNDLKSQEGEDKLYEWKLRRASSVCHLFRISVSQNEYNNEKRQRITVRAVAPVEWAAESKILLEEISKKKTLPF